MVQGLLAPGESVLFVVRISVLLPDSVPVGGNINLTFLRSIRRPAGMTRITTRTGNESNSRTVTDTSRCTEKTKQVDHSRVHRYGT